MSDSNRESMEFDVVIVGGGPSGLAAAIRLMQLGEQSGKEISVCLVEKGSAIGSHILSGAVFYPRALTELVPDWKDRGAPLNTPVVTDEYYALLNESQSFKLPSALVPKPIHNHGNYAISLGNLCRWMGELAEEMGVMIFPGFAATELLYDGDKVVGVATGDMGIDANGDQKSTYQAGFELLGRYTLLAEGCRGQLGKQLISKHGLDQESGTQHYAIGLKELWEIPDKRHQAGTVLHTLCWPLGMFTGASGGGFLYHLEDNQVSLGLIIDLSYKNPYLSPYDEFQRWKTHPLVKEHLDGGTRLSYGARAIAKGGYSALPQLAVPGAALIGDDAGFLNTLKIKGSHTAIKSGMLGAEAVFEAIEADQSGTEIKIREKFEDCWLHEELRSSRNAGPAWHKFGMVFGSAWSFVEQNIFRGWSPFALKDPKPDHESLKPAQLSRAIEYPKPDGVFSFDKLSSVFVSNTNHEEDQPCHLTLKDETVPISYNLPMYAEPAQRYCPAGVYEVVEENGVQRFQINAQNCVHCKTCDIKDPTQNITWIAPEGSGGPNYPNM